MENFDESIKKICSFADEQFREALEEFEKIQKCMLSPASSQNCGAQRISKQQLPAGDRAEVNSVNASKGETQNFPDGADFNATLQRTGCTNSSLEIRKQLSGTGVRRIISISSPGNDNDWCDHFGLLGTKQKLCHVDCIEKVKSLGGMATFVRPLKQPSGNNTGLYASDNSALNTNEDPTINDISFIIKSEKDNASTPLCINNKAACTNAMEDEFHHPQDENISAVLENFDLTKLASNFIKTHHNGALSSPTLNRQKLECARMNSKKGREMASQTNPTPKHSGAENKKPKQDTHREIVPIQSENIIAEQKNEIDSSLNRQQLSIASELDDISVSSMATDVHFNIKSKEQSYILRKLSRLSETLCSADNKYASNGNSKGRRTRLLREANAATIIQAAYRGKICRQRKLGAILVTVATLARYNAKSKIAQISMEDIWWAWFKYSVRRRRMRRRICHRIEKAMNSFGGRQWFQTFMKTFNRAEAFEWGGKHTVANRYLAQRRKSIAFAKIMKFTGMKGREISLST